MGALGRTARRLKAGLAALFLIALAAALAPRDAQAQSPVLTATAGNEQVTLNWTYTGSGLTGWGYKINGGTYSWAGTPIVIPASNSGTRSHTVTGLMNGTSYQFIVYAQTDANTAFRQSNQVSATPQVPAPTLISGPDNTIRTAETTTLVCYNLLSVSQGGVTYLEARQGKTAVTAHSALADASHGVEITQAPAGVTKGRGVNLSPCVNLGKGVHTVTWSWRGPDGAATAGTTSTTITITDPVTATPLKPPTGLTVVPGPDRLYLSWTAPTDSNRTGWQVRYREYGETWSDWAAINGAGSTSYTITGLMTNRTYEVQLRATDGSRFSTAAEGSGATLSGLSVRSFVGSRVLVNEGGSETYFIKLLARGTGPVTVTPASANGDLSFSPTSLTFSITNWDEEQNMTVSAAGDTDEDDENATITYAVSGGGYPSISNTTAVKIKDTGTSASVTPTLARPRNLRATAGNRQVSLAWTKPPGAITGYEVRYVKTGAAWSEWTAIPGSGASTESHTVSGLDGGSSYTFEVRAVNSAGKGLESQATATPTGSSTPIVTAPAAPTGLSAAPGNGQVMLTWTDPDDDSITGYQVQQRKGSAAWDSWTSISGSDADTVSHTVTGLDNDSEYRIRIRAQNSGGNSAASAAVRATPVAPAAPVAPGVTAAKPTGLVAAAGNGLVTLSWTDPDNPTITKWQVRRKVGSGAWGEWTDIAGSGAGTTSHEVSGLDNGTAYQFEVRAVNGAGNGAGPDAPVTATPTAPALPATGGGVTVTPTALTVVEGSSVTYTVALDTQPSGEVTVAVSGVSGDVTVEGSPLTFTTANYGTPQTVTVRAAEDPDTVTDPDVTLTHSASGGGYGSVSIASVVVSVTENDTPPAPTGLAATAGNGQVALLWTDPNNASITGYQVRYDKTGDRDSATWVAIGSSGAGTISHTVTGLENGSEYSFQLRAQNAVGEGAATGWVTATPIATTTSPTTPSTTPTPPATGGRVTVTPTALTVEEGGSGRYTVALDTQPSGEVTVTLGGASGDVTASPASLTFTRSNYSTAQTVTVTAAEDEDAVTDAAVTLTHRASGGGYDAVSIGEVTVTITEDDEAAVTLSRLSLALDEGNSGRYTVVLESQPVGGEVTVTPGSADSSALTVLPSALRFTVANWNTAQTVTVTAARDDDTDDETVRVRHAVSGGDYDRVGAPSVTVTVTDTTAAERAGRANRVNARVLPQVAAATLSQTLTAVTERIGAVASGNPGASLQFGALSGRTLEEEWKFLPRSEPSAPSVSEMLDGATFALPLKMSGNQTTSQLSRLAAWGRGERVSLSGEEEDISWDGDLWSAHLGADMHIRPDLLAGAALSYGEGEVDTQTTDNDGSRIAGTYETTLTAIHPYVSHVLVDGSHLWGSMGYGQGEVRIREGSATRKTDLSQWSVALGGRRVLLEEAGRIAGGITRIALKGEGALAQLDTDAQEELTELTVKTTRLRLLLEGSHERALEGDATLTPALEAGLRHDGGDLGRGLGLEAGASLTWRDSQAGWLAQLHARSLVAHEKDRDEWGISALVRVEPAADGRGLSLSFGPEYGHTDSGMESWFDYRLSPATVNSATRDDMGSRLEAELGYGIGLSRTGAMALLTPYTGFSLGQSGSETFRVGARYRLGEGLSVGIEGKHQSQAVGENSLMLRAAIRW